VGVEARSVSAMAFRWDTEAVDQFTRHYAVVRELFDRLPLVMDDAVPRAPGGL
jgi:hypothetical protein